MRSDDQAVIMLVLGVFLARVVISGHYRYYVQGSLLVPLVVTVAVLLGVAATSLRTTHKAASAAQARADELGGHDHLDDDGHGHGPGRMAYLLAVPVVVFIVVAPSPLGAAAAGQVASAPDVADVTDVAPLPPPRDGAVDLTIGQAAIRATASADGGLQDQPVRLTGFVVQDDRVPEGYVLTRFMIGCCAADAIAQQVGIDGVDQVPPDETWQEVEAVWRGTTVEAGDHVLPVFDVQRATTIPEPAAPYE